jgi:thiol-disulfide isomerase/thioredoxin
MFNVSFWIVGKGEGCVQPNRLIQSAKAFAAPTRLHFSARFSATACGNIGNFAKRQVRSTARLAQPANHRFLPLPPKKTLNKRHSCVSYNKVPAISGAFYPVKPSIMKKIILALVAAALVLPALAGDFPKGSPKFEESYRQVMADAKKSGKPVIVVFSASWCPPCQQMKNTVYPSKEIQPFHDQFEWAYLDVDDNDNEKAAKEFGVQGIPHIQFVDSEGKTLDQQVGGSAPEDFANTLKGVLAKAGKTAKATAAN